MLTYILIIILQNTGPAATSIPGFKNLQECENAAADVKATSNLVKAVCVKQSK